MDVDVALESSRLARNSVKVQASAAMVAWRPNDRGCSYPASVTSTPSLNS